jgi:stage V sporulation protein R
MNRDKALIERVACEMEELAKEFGLDCYPQVFEWVTPEQMAMLIARDGSRLKYPHWSYGKAYRRHLKEIEKFRYALDAHELVLNSNPCVAYLVENTVTPILILVIGHVYGHNDFFKANIAFKDSDAEHLLELRSIRSKRVRELSSYPGIGVEKVESMLDAARTIMYHRTGIEPSSPMWLEFFAAHAPRLEDWERELLLIVNDEAKEELRYIQTKTMNEGWASFWQMDFISRADIPYRIKDEAAHFHAQLTAAPERPTLSFNPYNVGILMWRSIRERFGKDQLFEVRRDETDVSFFERYLTQDVAIAANLAWFEFSPTGEVLKVIPAEEADSEIWFKIKASLVSMLPIHSIPFIAYAGIGQNEVLMMQHFHDGRDLDLDDAKQVLRQIAMRIWKGSVWLLTFAKEKECAIRVNAFGEIS